MTSHFVNTNVAMVFFLILGFVTCQVNKLKRTGS